MRPVTKWSNILPDGTARHYAKHGDAKGDLMSNIGDYCSYCEVWGTKSHIEVEHILYYDGYPAERTAWNNFLLSCKNCNTIKGESDLDVVDVFLPHKANTFSIIHVLEGGLIVVNPDLADPAIIAKAQTTLELTGQDRVPGHPRYSKKDNRWELRKAAWDLAKRYLAKWEAGCISAEDIVEVAAQRGFWSIWLSVFAGHPAVKRQFIADTKSFKGTCQACFDAAGNPVNRNGADL